MEAGMQHSSTNAGRCRMTFGNRSTSRWYLCPQPLVIQAPFPFWRFRQASTRTGKRKIAWCGINSSTPAKNTSSSTRSAGLRSEEHTSELQSLAYLVCRLLLEKKKKKQTLKVYCNKAKRR